MYVAQDTSDYLTHLDLHIWIHREIEDRFVFDSMPDTPSEITACERYADYFRPLVKSV